MSGITTAEYDIKTVLQTPLASLTSIASDHVVYMNTIYTNNDNEPFIATYIVGSGTRQAGLGTYGKQVYDGIFQINIFVPVGNGLSILNTITSELKSIYFRGATLYNDEISVKCKIAYEGTADHDDDWYMLPFNVDYYAYVDNE
jgi:hypothetical protein